MQPNQPPKKRKVIESNDNNDNSNNYQQHEDNEYLPPTLEPAIMNLPPIQPQSYNPEDNRSILENIQMQLMLLRDEQNKNFQKVATQNNEIINLQVQCNQSLQELTKLVENMNSSDSESDDAEGSNEKKEEKFCCPQCNKKFTLQHNLTRHIKEVHSGHRRNQQRRSNSSQPPQTVVEANKVISLSSTQQPHQDSQNIINLQTATSSSAIVGTNQADSSSVQVHSPVSPQPHYNVNPANTQAFLPPVQIPSPANQVHEGIGNQIGGVQQAGQFLMSIQQQQQQIQQYQQQNLQAQMMMAQQMHQLHHQPQHPSVGGKRPSPQDNNQPKRSSPSDGSGAPQNQYF